MRTTNTTTRRLTIGAFAAIAVAMLYPLTSSASGVTEARASTTLTTGQRKEIRAATHRFRDVDTALAAGYVPTDECAAIPGVGAMGFHYANPANLTDGVIDPTKPDILLYHLTDDGELKLGGVEYFAADADQDLTTDADRPNLYGQRFDGPMPGHEPGMPIHYDLHVWLYTKNPAGLLAAWNPRVECPTPPPVHHLG